VRRRRVILGSDLEIPSFATNNRKSFDSVAAAIFAQGDRRWGTRRFNDRTSSWREGPKIAVYPIALPHSATREPADWD
jgi:hypothetical protein